MMSIWKKDIQLAAELLRARVGALVIGKDIIQDRQKIKENRQNLAKSDQILFGNRIFESYGVNLSIEC